MYKSFIMMLWMLFPILVFLFMMGIPMGWAAEEVSLVKDILVGPDDSNPFNLTNVNGALFFAANGGFNGHRLWKSDGTAQGTVGFDDLSSWK